MPNRRIRSYILIGTFADRLEAAAMLWKLRAAGDHDTDLADVRIMDNPPRTANRWAVIRWKR